MTGEELKRARKALGMSRSELAKAIGSNHSTIGSWETGRHNVSAVAEKSIRDLMEANGVLVDKIQEEFERWLKSVGNLTMKEGDGEYSFQHTRFAFEAWKASRAALRVKLPSFDNGSLRGYGGDCEEARAVVDYVAESLEKAGVSYE